jgi:glycosyltransferase involved in cell wall biosynthesis
MTNTNLSLLKNDEYMELGLTVIVPVFNEEKTICDAICELVTIRADFPYEIVVINDGSTDSTSRILKWPKHILNIRYVEKTQNEGKGNAVKTGLNLARYSHVLIFDADLEYFGHDIARLFRPIQMGIAPAVYGIRLRGINTMQPSFVFAYARKALTFIANLIYGTAISDLHTCLKLFPTDFLKSLELNENGFGLDTEITALALRSGILPFEIPVSYVGRTKHQGKKIRVSDGFKCIKILIGVRLRKDIDYQVRTYAKRNVNFVSNSSRPVELQNESFL